MAIKTNEQGGYSPVMIKFSDFSPTFPDILREHRWSIAPHNSSDMTSIGNNFNYFKIIFQRINWPNLVQFKQ